MRQLTKEALKIVNQLYDVDRRGSGLPWTNKESITRNLLNQLAEVGEVAALPCVARFLSSSDEEILRCLRRTIATLITRLSPNELLHFTELYDWASEWYTNHLWGVIVRLNCCRCLSLIHRDDISLAALDGMTKDRFMPIRREAFRQKAEHFPDTADEMWKYALLDQHSSIRELACWHVRNTSHAAPNAYYRNALQENPESLSALEGLSETGDESDIEYFRQLLTHSLPSRRCIAVQGLVRVGKEASVRMILPYLRDESPSVVRAVCKGVSSNLSAVSDDELVAVAMHGESLFGRNTAVRLLADLGKWRCLPNLLKVASGPDADTSEFAQQIIRQTCNNNRVFTTPSQDNKEKIADALAKSRDSLPPEIVCLIETELKRFG